MAKSEPSPPRPTRTLAERIEWILRRHGIGQRELSRRAGLDVAHIGQFLARARKDPNVSLNADTLAKVANGAKVSMRWLATGEGPPEDSAALRGVEFAQEPGAAPPETPRELAEAVSLSRQVFGFVARGEAIPQSLALKLAHAAIEADPVAMAAARVQRPGGATTTNVIELATAIMGRLVAHHMEGVDERFREEVRESQQGPTVDSPNTPEGTTGNQRLILGPRSSLRDLVEKYRAKGLPPEEFAVLAARAGAPRRARWEEASGAVVGASDPAEAWETLATRGLVPFDWVESTRRRFAAEDASEVDGHSLAERPSLRLLPYPPTIEAAVAVAADLPEVIAAESLALEYLRRLRGLTAVPLPPGDPEQIVWSFTSMAPGSLSPFWGLPEVPSDWFSALEESGDVPFGIDVGARVGHAVERRLPRTAWGKFVGHLAEQAHLWSIAVHAGWKIPSGAHKGEPFGVIEDPYPPLLGIMERGYALGGWSDRAVILVAPLPPAPARRPSTEASSREGPPGSPKGSGG